MKENLFKILFLLFIISIFYLVLNTGFFNKESKGDDYVMYSLDLSNYKVATFSGGCFWCMEPPFERLPGVAEVMNGYTGGNEADPKYQEVASGKTGHLESIQVYYDPDLISYETLLEVYWMSIDPTDPGGQFADRGNHYTTAIFYHDENQKILAEKSKDALASSGRFSLPIATVIREAMPFYPAETYHQDYYIKSSIQFDPYHKGSGRARFLDEVWGNEIMKYAKIYTKPDLEKIKSFLTPLQFKVTQENATEPPFNNLYWNNEDNEGIYVDIVSGEPLFSSKDMFDSGSGWPSFTKPLVPLHLMYKLDSSIGNNRIEVRSKFADSHLGHVFNDGPPPTGLRYCINSAALKFIPKNDLRKKGFPEFIKFFD